MATSEELNFDSLKIENYLEKYFKSTLTKDEGYHFEKVPSFHRPTRKQRQEISSAQYRNQMNRVKMDIQSSFLSLDKICDVMKKRTKEEWNDFQTKLGLARITLSKINFILNVSVEQSRKEDEHWSKFIRTALKLYIARLELDNEEVEVAMKTNTQEVSERFEASESATDPAEQEIFIKNLFKTIQKFEFELNELLPERNRQEVYYKTTPNFDGDREKYDEFRSIFVFNIQDKEWNDMITLSKKLFNHLSGDAAMYVYLNTPNRFNADCYRVIWDLLEQKYGVSPENPTQPRKMPTIVKFEGRKGTFKYLFKYFVAMMENFGGDPSIDLNQILMSSLRGPIRRACKRRFPSLEQDTYSQIWEYLLKRYGHEVTNNEQDTDNESDQSESTPNTVPDSCIPTSKLRRDMSEKFALTREQFEAITTISSVLTYDAKPVQGGILHTYTEAYRDFDGITVKEILQKTETHQASGYTPAALNEKTARLNVDKNFGDINTEEMIEEPDYNPVSVSIKASPKIVLDE